jgi:hypothetical protein
MTPPWQARLESPPKSVSRAQALRIIDARTSRVAFPHWISSPLYAFLG